MRRNVETKEDMSQPIKVLDCCTNNACGIAVQESAEAYNRYVMTERESHGRRTKIRIGPEIYMRKGAQDISYVRLRNTALTMDVPNSTQAELVWKAVERLLRSMDGKVLVAPPSV